jgi:hypothetical protein
VISLLALAQTKIEQAFADLLSENLLDREWNNPLFSNNQMAVVFD